MEIREGWVVVLLIAVGFAAFLFGRVVAWEGVKWDCVRLEKFKYGSAVYECRQIKAQVE